MNVKTQSAVRTAVSFFLSFLISLLVFFLTLLLIAIATVGNENFMNTMYEKGEFYRYVTEEIREEYVNLGIPGGVQEDFFDDAIDEATLYRDVTGQIAAAYRGESYTVNEQAHKDFLYEKLVQYAAEKEIALTDDVKGGLNHMVDLCVKVYTESVSNVFILQIGKLANRFSTPLLLASGVLIVLIACLSFFLFRLHRWKHRPIRYLQYSVIAASLMLIVFPLIAMLSNFSTRLNISAPSLYHLVNTYIFHLLLSLILTGVGLAFIGMAILTLLYIRLRKNYD